MRPVGPQADVNEMEYIACLHQAPKPKDKEPKDKKQKEQKKKDKEPIDKSKERDDGSIIGKS